MSFFESWIDRFIMLKSAYIDQFSGAKHILFFDLAANLKFNTFIIVCLCGKSHAWLRRPLRRAAGGGIPGGGEWGTKLGGLLRRWCQWGVDALLVGTGFMAWLEGAGGW